ncbi:MAG: dTDP-glucose 4,6-dehydratase [Candidatus Pacearchaeota archaeon]|jgi:dTDP-glucose 4,6-dehydratase
MKVLVTGGSGFIGSNFIRYLLTSSETKQAGIEKVINLDLQTYAGQGRNIEHMGLDKDPRYVLVQGDICDPYASLDIFQKYSPDLLFNFAAESHVDNSLSDNSPFLRTNIEGTRALAFTAAKRVKRFVHISTDEVYGSIKDGSFVETSPLSPSNPYAQTKASAEGVIMEYTTSRGLPAVITRSANNYGPYQFPEKLLPLFITNLVNGQPVPLMWSKENPGLNVRDWLHVEDNCRAIWYVSKKANTGDVYNIPGDNERTNIEMTRMLLSHFGVGEDMIKKSEHRKAHDFRYSISGDKLKSLGFEYKHLNLNSEVNALCSWYEQNPSWWGPLKK